MIKNPNGNALFLILIAVALFAALSYAVTNSGRGGGGIDKEQAELAAASLLQYVAAIETAHQRLKIVGNYNWSRISYGGSNADCADADCALFDSQGGGAPSLTMVPANAIGDPNSKNARIRFIDNAGIGTNTPDLGILIAGIPFEVCKAVNRAVGIEVSNATGVPFNAGNSGGSGPHDINVTNYSSTSLSATTATANPSGYNIEHTGVSGASPEVAGKRTFCICMADNVTTCSQTDPWFVRFWHVLEAR